jgi:hypothetical protein
VLKRIRRLTLPELFVKKTHLHWNIVTTILALFLLIGLFITALTSDTPFNSLGWNFWRVGLQGPVIIIYIMIIYPILTKIGDNAIESIIPSVDMSEDDLFKLEIKYRVPNRLWEGISLSMGFVIILLLSQPWRGTIVKDNVFLLLTEMIMFSLLSLLIYYGFHNARYMTLINKRIKLDLFNLEVFGPTARWSLNISLAFMGGIIISILFQNIDNLRQWQVILIYSIIIISTVAMFFISLWSTHAAIVKTKKHELILAQDKLNHAYRKMILSVSGNNIEDTINDANYSEVGAWAALEKRIRETKEWPYNAGIIRQLIISIISSSAIYVVKLLLGYLSF